MRISTLTISAWLPGAPPPAYTPAENKDPFAASYAPSITLTPERECWKSAWSEKCATERSSVYAGPVKQHTDGGVRLTGSVTQPRNAAHIHLTEVPPAYMRYSQYS